MSQKKPISEQERQRRARQAAEQAANAGGPKIAGHDSKRGGFNPSTTVPKHQKKTGRGT